MKRSTKEDKEQTFLLFQQLMARSYQANKFKIVVGAEWSQMEILPTDDPTTFSTPLVDDIVNCSQVCGLSHYVWTTEPGKIVFVVY